MSKCENCKNGYWEDFFDNEGFIDSHFVCEKGLYENFNCEGFKPYEEIESNYKLEIPKECISQCSNQSLQGCTIYFRDIKDLKCGDTFVLKSLSYGCFEKGEMWNVELQKIYKVGE